MVSANKNELRELDKVKTGDYLIIAVKTSYYILKVHGFILDKVDGDSKFQLSAVYPKSGIFVNNFYSFETLYKLEAKKVEWTDAKKLIRLLYG